MSAPHAVEGGALRGQVDLETPRAAHRTFRPYAGCKMMNPCSTSRYVKEDVRQAA